MEILLFANVAEGKSSNKILFNLFVVNFKLHFHINVEYKVALLSPSRSFKLLRISTLVFSILIFKFMRKVFLEIWWVKFRLKFETTFFLMLIWRPSHLQLQKSFIKTWLSCKKKIEFPKNTFHFSHFHFERFFSSFSFPELSN
jgi:hypothetical protein